jgi:1,4-dihydroxy-2-naphthoyl-CoA hydrolase
MVRSAFLGGDDVIFWHGMSAESSVLLNEQTQCNTHCRDSSLPAGARRWPLIRLLAAVCKSTTQLNIEVIAMAATMGYGDLKKNPWLARLGIEVTHSAAGKVVGQLMVRPNIVTPTGFIHAGAIVSMADALCGSGTEENLPAGAAAHTTIELKVNLLGTAHEGIVECAATLVHGGRTTQVWDAAVTANGKTIALFRCTQLILYPPAK